MPSSVVLFPNLHAGNHRVMGPATRKYNCIGWAAGHDDQWWEPAQPADPDRKYYWPPNAPRDYDVTSLIVAFESVGFVVCADGSKEAGIEKIAVYADGSEWMHAARQLENGKWSSKMGENEQIEHDALDDLAGPA